MNETRPDSLAELVRAGGRREVPPRADYDQVLGAATATWRRTLHTRRRQRWWAAIAAGTVLFAVGLALLQWRPSVGEPVVAGSLVRGTLDALPVGASEWRRLPPGAAIKNGARLRASGPTGASISLVTGGTVRVKATTDLTLQPGAHLQLLSGAIFIDSAGRASSDPLLVETALGQVRDIGTVFTVQVSPDDLSVRVREGQVRVYKSDRVTLDAHAGDEWRVQADGSTERIAIPVSGPEWAWAEALAGSPVVDGKPLLGLLEWVAHESGRALIFPDADVRNQAAAVLLHGNVPDLKPLDALATMLAATDFDYRLNDAGAIIIERRPL